MKTNKDVIEALIAYFKEHSDFETLARAMANQMLDCHRILNLRKLPLEEAQCFAARMKKNDETFVDFVKNGNKEKYRLKIIQNAEELA